MPEVRPVTRNLIEAAPRLRVVGRAGVGIDNVDVPAATQHGVVVMNTPAGNTVSTAELTFALILNLARKVSQACASMTAGRWERKEFLGTELSGKTLGVLGLGRIGSEVARRALAFEMKVAGYDPFLTEAHAKALGIELAADLDEVYRDADFITVHLPATEHPVIAVVPEERERIVEPHPGRDLEGAGTTRSVDREEG